MTLRGALRAATIALFATAASATTPSSVLSQDLSCEPGDLEVRDLDFRGNRALDDDDLALRVLTTPSSWFRRRLRVPLGPKRCLEPSRRELGRDILRLKSYYRDRGFYFVEVDTLVQRLSATAVRVVFNIVEGNPLRLTSYTVTGLEGIPDSADITRRLQLKVGDPFDFLRFGADMDTIVRRLRDAGYYRASTIPGYDWDTSGVAHAEASITVVPGKLARFGRDSFDLTNVDGERDVEIDTSVVRRLLGIRQGQLFSDRAILQAQRSLFALGTYQHIAVAPLPDTAQPPGDTIVRLGVQLREDYMRQLDSEFGWATLDCGRLRLQYTDKNFARTARRLEMTAQASKIGYGRPLANESSRHVCTLGNQTPLTEDQFSDTMHYFTGFAIRQPRLLGTQWVPTLSLYSERRGEYKAYLRSTIIGADFAATRELGDRMPLRVGYTFEYGRTKADAPALCVLFNRCDDESRRQIQDTLARLGVVSVALARVRTDNVVSPRRGLMMRGEVRSSAWTGLGTTPSLFFNKGTADIAWYTPLGLNNVFTLRVRGGAVLGRRLRLSDLTGFIPPQERLYAGGATSVRGFQQNELGELVYIARNRDVRIDSVLVGSDWTYQFTLTNPASSPDRTVPLGGKTLFVANVEYRIRDPFFFPDHLQYTLFVDGGDVWDRTPTTGGGAQIKWTPGFGMRAITPVGPMQINVGWNGYNRVMGPLYYNPDVNLLACLSPEGGIPLDYRRNPTTRQFEQAGPGTCGEYQPPKRKRLLQQLTFTFSIGPDF